MDDGENLRLSGSRCCPAERLAPASRPSERTLVRCPRHSKKTLNEWNSSDAGNAIDIPVGTAHRVMNPHENEPLIFVEIQTGDYFGEDDIERLDDDFGRAGGI